ncbi:MAG: 4-vinyl reductase [Acidobacteriota bacterium]
MADIKGFAIRGLLKFIKDSNYPGGIPAIISKLPAEDRAVFATPINASLWYAYHVFAHLLCAVDKTIGKGDKSLARRVGGVSAERDVQGVFRIIAAITSFQRLLPKATLFWPRYFSSGKLEVLDITDRSARLVIRNFPEIDPTHCALMEGWFEKIGQIFGAKDMRVRHTACVHRGHAVCEFTATFS